MTTALIDTSSPQGSGPKPLTEGKQPVGIMVALWAFVIIPFVALVAAVPVAWGGWLSWADVPIAVIMYLVTAMGTTAGFNRNLTHGPSKANRWVGTLRATPGPRRWQAPVTQWAPV